jgi:hypothetical protein
LANRLGRSLRIVLGPAQIDRFIADGFVAIRGAVPSDVVAACRADIEDALRTRGVDPDDPSTWTQPVVRLDCPWTPAFAAAGTQPVLHETYDELLGADAWVRLPGVGGTIPVRFPSDEDPGDAGWHVDGSFDVGGLPGNNIASCGRGLLVLFLFSDIGSDDAPTELKVGSHLDLPAVLEPFGDAGADFITVAGALPASTLQRPSVFAVGTAGDVFVCHPFLVHRATWPHRGTRPRAIAQPAIATHHPFPLDGNGASPVEQAILAGLARPA